MITSNTYKYESKHWNNSREKYQDGTFGKSSAMVLEFTEVTDLLQARSIAADWTMDNRFLDVEESLYEKNHYFVPITSTARFFLEII